MPSTPRLQEYSLHTPEKIRRQIADRTRELRLDRGWKQTTLAERAGVSLGSLRRFERTGKVSLDNLLRLAFALHRLDDFAALLEPPPVRSIDELERREEKDTPKRGTI